MSEAQLPLQAVDASTTFILCEQSGTHGLTCQVCMRHSVYASQACQISYTPCCASFASTVSSKPNCISSILFCQSLPRSTYGAASLSDQTHVPGDSQTVSSVLSNLYHAATMEQRQIHRSTALGHMQSVLLTWWAPHAVRVASCHRCQADLFV